MNFPFYMSFRTQSLFFLSLFLSLYFRIFRRSGIWRYLAASQFNYLLYDEHSMLSVNKVEAAYPNGG